MRIGAWRTAPWCSIAQHLSSSAMRQNQLFWRNEIEPANYPAFSGPDRRRGSSGRVERRPDPGKQPGHRSGAPVRTGSQYLSSTQLSNTGGRLFPNRPRWREPPPSLLGFLVQTMNGVRWTITVRCHEAETLRKFFIEGGRTYRNASGSFALKLFLASSSVHPFAP